MKKLQKALVGTAIVGSVLGAGAFGVTLVSSASATTDVPSATSTPDPGDTADTTAKPFRGEVHGTGPGSGPHGESGGGHVGPDGTVEELLTGDTAEKVTAAVLAEHPDATVLRVETDADGAAYEAHISQADGTHATVKLDESFAVTSTETGPAGGRHGGPRGTHDHTDDGTEPGLDTDTDADTDADVPDGTNGNASEAL